jgi:LDH2 family malate/lactate/ureidoglycolate dehydrogenase
MNKEQILRELNINEWDTHNTIMLPEIREKLLLASILNQGIDIASSILARYRELADILKI